MDSATRIFRRPRRETVERWAWFAMGFMAGLVACGFVRFAWPAFFT